MAEAVAVSKRCQRLFWLRSLISLAYLAALACLRQWGTAHPWSRLDRFSGGFLLFSLLWTASNLRYYRVILLQSREVLREAFGASFDLIMPFCALVVSVAELSIFLDYGHWHLVPALEKPLLQWLGLGLYFLGALWLLWAETHLARHFSNGWQKRKLLTTGPFRYVRHPLYAGLLISSVALALVLASLLGWILLLPWRGMVLRRVRREEAHLRQLFGANYDAYAARTARLLPGVF